jgi:hypothetical protein
MAFTPGKDCRQPVNTSARWCPSLRREVSVKEHARHSAMAIALLVGLFAKYLSLASVAVRVSAPAVLSAILIGSAPVPMQDVRKKTSRGRKQREGVG